MFMNITNYKNYLEETFLQNIIIFLGDNDKNFDSIIIFDS